jgi:hypothetical protein
MSQAAATLDRIQELQKEITSLQAQALRELRAERDGLATRVAAIDTQLEELTGAGAPKKAAEERELNGRSIPLSELKELLAAAPDKTISIRKEGLQLANIKTLARVNPGLLRMGGKGPWPTVTMIKYLIRQ